MPHERRLGFVTGPIVLCDEQGQCDLCARAWTGPCDDASMAIKVAEHKARFVLLVEKQTIFARLVEDGFPAKRDCVLLCGNGYPGRTFRKFVRHLHDQLCLPFYVLADNDPAVYKLFFLIARGGLRGDGAARRAVAIPEALYIGLNVRDYDRLGLRECVQIPLNETDREQLARLRAYSWLVSNKAWLGEIDALANRGFKVEMEALCSVSISCLAETYLPERLRATDFLRL